jgi:hypothetical protein
MILIREEDDSLFLKKEFLDTGTLLKFKQPAYVHGLSKARAGMYACIPTAGRVHLYNFSKNKTNSQANKTGSTVMEDRNPLKTQKLSKNSKKVVKPIKTPKTISQKNPRGFPSMVTNYGIAGKPPYGLH